ncbi:SA1362 family protein [Alkalihalobacillus sp. TS-13]|uniref:SA1362 family protein n=1 Tax=Alkalihalobacillus sp. TS-13 TaxID=2842455 RepID=UPI001C88D159|nr:SA1362 family protein [Alkalihalobacillus sp. TS-13]
MLFRKFNVLVMLILGLAAFGFINTVITNPMYLVRMVLIIAAVGGIFYFLYKRFLAKRFGGGGGKDVNKYKQAARYSAKKYQNQPGNVMKKPPKIKPSPQTKPSVSKKKKRANDHNFKVIEGKKGKKKNRAL